MKYVVQITESYTDYFIVEAEDEIEATNTAIELYQKGDINLDSSIYCNVGVGCIRKANDYDTKLYDTI